MVIGRFRAKNRTVFTVLGVLAFFLLAYFAIIPTVVARHYAEGLNGRIIRVKANLKAVSTGSNVVVFEDPDIPLAQRQLLVDQTLVNIEGARRSLAELEHANDLPALPGNGFAGDYHKAVVREERIGNVVRQSRQVLDSYAATLQYINAYTDVQLYMDRELRFINDVRDFETLRGSGRSVMAIASQLWTDRKQVESLKPPPDFAPLRTEAMATFSQAAIGFERLANGLNQASDTEIYGAVRTLEQIADKNDLADKEMITDLARTSPILLQLAELPEKIEHAQVP